jgi:predicted Zn-dependent protease
MLSRGSRIFISFALISALFFSITGAVAGQQQKQDSTASETQSQKQVAAASNRPAPVSSKQNAKPLAEDEDPAMIGKRKIPTGLIQKMSMSVDKEIRLGRQLAAEVDRQAKFIDDLVITEYVNRVAQNLVLHSDAKIPFTVKVIDSDEVNAFALPGGFFYVNKGLILASDNEAELAGVMAHEISHVICRHAVRNQTKAEIAQVGTLAGVLLGGPIIGNVLYSGSGFFEGLAFMKFSRNYEAEADQMGTQYLYASGYDPTALATMFEKLEGKEKKKPGTMAKLFADHPAPADRRAASLALAARFPEREEYVINTSEFNRVKARLLRLSNSRATTGEIKGSDDGTPGRPTLKRRQPTPDDSSQPPDGTQKPADSNSTDPPKLKRNPNPDPNQPPATQPSDKPKPE